MTPIVGIIDYSVGNLRSVANAFVKVGGNAVFITEPEDVAAFDRIVLPGVGAFGSAIANLRNSGMADALDRHAKSGKPLMGICLGMQLMCRDSLEDGFYQGLGWINASVIPLPQIPGLKIPHMGWNSVRAAKKHSSLEGFLDDSDVYFVHSYHASCHDRADVLLTCEYGGEFVAGFARDNLVGLQFHPEKSQATGLRILSNFLCQ